jgi:hypothetical protein
MEQDWFGNDVYSLFDKQQAAGRINRQIFTGNLIKAFEKYPNGKLINYTDDQGNVRQGLMIMNQLWNKKVSTRKEGKPEAYWDGWLDRVTRKRNHQMRDGVNKAAKLIVQHCLNYGKRPYRDKFLLAR